MNAVVVKCGGAVASEAAGTILPLAEPGRPVCVVHGAGPQISAEMARRGLPVLFVAGRRVTEWAALAVVHESLAAVNAALCTALGPRSIGFMGDDLGLVARRVRDFGFVGEPVPSRPAPVVDALAAGRIPVVAPLARGPLNVNGDEMAAALAVGLGASRLLFVSDVPGVLIEGSPLAAIEADEADRLLREGVFEGGIVPKLHAAVAAARRGVRTEIGETTVVPGASG